MKTIYLLALLPVIALAGCNKPAVQPVADFAAEERAIRAADAQWLAAAKARELDKTVAAWSEDAIIYAPGAPPIKGRQAIREYVAGAFALPDFSVTWESGPITFASSGDMAYMTGTDEFISRAPDGRLVKEKNKAVVIWRKQSDGSWKAAVDIWNALPAPGPPIK